MGLGKQSVEEHLVVGAPALLHAATARGQALRYKTSIRGWETGAYIILDLPVVNERFIPLRQNQDCIVRFFTNGKVCGFNSVVLDIGSSFLNPYFRASWPSEIELVTLRRHERVEVLIPCRISSADNQEYDGEITDLSIGGCRIRTPLAAFPDDRISLSFSLPDGVQIGKLRAVVRSAQTTATGTCLGCEFAGEGGCRTDIEFFVTAALERLRQSASPPPSVLIVDEDAAAAGALVELLTTKGHQAAVVPGIVDACSRVRHARPRAILVNQQLKGVPGLDFCRILKATPGLEGLPVFVYGSGVTKEQATKSGATGCFASLSDQDALLQCLSALPTPADKAESE